MLVSHLFVDTAVSLFTRMSPLRKSNISLRMVVQYCMLYTVRFYFGTSLVFKRFLCWVFISGGSDSLATRNYKIMTLLEGILCLSPVHRLRRMGASIDPGIGVGH